MHNEDERKKEAEHSTIVQSQLAVKAYKEAEARKGMPRQQMAKPDTAIRTDKGCITIGLHEMV